MSDSASVLETLEICEDMEETTLLMLDSVGAGRMLVSSGSSKPPDSVVVAFGALVGVGCTITGAVPVDAEVYPVPWAKVALAVLDAVESGRRPVRRGSKSPPDSEVVVGAALLEVSSMIVDKPTSTGPVVVFAGVPAGASVLAGAVGETSLTGTPPVPVG